LPPPTTMGTRNRCSSSTSPALMACPARSAPPTVMSCSVAGFSCRIMPGSKFRSIRVLAPGTDWSVVENTIFSAACQMPVNSRAAAGWPGTVWAVWSTAFGYFDDTANRAVLDGIVRVLRPGGQLAMDLDNLPRFLASYSPSRVVAAREEGDMLVDRYHLDALTGRFEAERTVIRSGRTRRVNFVKRLFGFPELRDWLLAAGFTTVAGHGEDAQPLTADHRRMIIVAGLP
jgi:hypothetical protein